MKLAVEAFLAKKRAKGLKEGSVDTYEAQLEQLLVTSANGGRALRWLLSHAAALYERCRADRAGDTHLNALATGRMFGRFCVKAGWLARDPFAAIEGEGRRKTGKPQLRVDEARTLRDFLIAALQRAVQPEVVAVYALLLLGPRATELIDRDVRDLDDGGRLLWIPDSKTAAGRRQLEIPEELRPWLLELARDKVGAVPLFTLRNGHRRRRREPNARASRHWLNYHCKALCAAAGVPVVPPHGLRGTHASIAARAGATGVMVSEQLGHAVAIPAVTDRSYVQASAKAAGRSSAVLGVLQGGRGA